MSYFLNGCVISIRRAEWTSRVPNYRGVASALWWPLTQHAKQDRRAGELTEALKTRWLTQPVDWLRPQASDDLDFIRSYVATCDELQLGPLYALVCASPEKLDAVPTWLKALQAVCDRVGIDVGYPHGEYSFVDDDFFSANLGLFEFLTTQLNDRGLFDRSEDAEEFMRLHQAANDRGANLEMLEGASPIELWEDSDLSQLRRILKQY